MVSDGPENVCGSCALGCRAPVKDDRLIHGADLDLSQCDIRGRNVDRACDVSGRKLRRRPYIQKQRSLVIDKVPGVHDDHGATPKKVTDDGKKEQGG